MARRSEEYSRVRFASPSRQNGQLNSPQAFVWSWPLSEKQMPTCSWRLLLSVLGSKPRSTRLFYSIFFFIWFAVFEIERLLENIFQKKLNISKTANRIKNVFWIKKTQNLIPRLFYSTLFLIRSAVFEIERFLENMFQKKLNISKTANRMKKVFWIKNTRNLIQRLLLFNTCFDPIRRFWDRAFFGKYFPNKG